MLREGPKLLGSSRWSSVYHWLALAYCSKNRCHIPYAILSAHFTWQQLCKRFIYHTAQYAK